MQSSFAKNNFFAVVALFIFQVCCFPAASFGVPPGEALVYKTVGSTELAIYVTKPSDWSAEDSRPAILFFHGGGWVGGSPGQFTEHAAYLAQRGMVCFQVQYRLLDKKKKLPPVTCTEDAIDAMQWVRKRAKEFGIAPDRIASAGGSAGGHLAAFLGTAAKLKEGEASPRPNAMLLFNPVYDNGPGAWGAERVGQRFDEFSPIHNISSATPPSVVFLGTKDKLIPVETAERFQELCKASGVVSKLFTYEGQEHGFFNTNRDNGRWFEATLRESERFLSELGWIDGPSHLPRARAKNVILITLDGLRQEEVFQGADQRLFLDDLGIKNPATYRKQYIGQSAEQSREMLLPFLWQQVAQEGWIAGDAENDSIVRVTNGRYFSYPGYNELLSGKADDRVDSNAKKPNQNVTVLEWLNQREDFRGKVAAYCSWDVFPFIINESRSGVPVNAGWETFTVGPKAAVDSLNFVSDNIFREWDSVRYDSLTARGAMLEMTTNAPRVLYISLGETDDWAHSGRYDRYLESAHYNDQIIKSIWELAQSLPEYANQTALVITTDHGRGAGREGWKNHSASLPGSEFIWIAAMGAGVGGTSAEPAAPYTQSQIAATVAALLDEDFTKVRDCAKPLPIVGMPSFAAP